MTVCPKCHYQRQASDTHVMAGVCPRCNIAYAKYKSTHGQAEAIQPSGFTQQPQTSLGEKLKAHCLFVPETIDDIGFWWRLVVTILFALWGISFIFGGVDWESIGGSFLHNVNLPFHEFGHVLFSPFGRFMGILGGSLFQVLFPLVFLVAFSFKQKDNFAAAIMLWWCGQNFIDVSPYIKDAPYRAIPLIRGMSEDAHDWGNLLTMTNSLASATSLANISFAIGSVIIILAMAWAAILLIKIKKQLHA